jgi:putative phosphoesterase
MKLMIASDIHGDAETAARLIEAYKASGAEKLLILGDILYHGPRNDLPAGYAPKKVIELFNAIADELICVRGNCDTEVDQMVLSFPILADYAVLYLDGLTVYATHGHKFNPTTPPPMKKGEILINGHTHIPAAEPFGNENFYINPGSVSIPKNDSHKSYILYENKEFVFYSLDGAVYDSCSFE